MKANLLTDPAAHARWWMETYKPEGDRTPYSKYRKLSDASYRLFKYAKVGAGYDARSNQVWVQVALPKDGDIDAALVELVLFLPLIHLTDGYKHVGVFEHTLSEHGMYELREYEESHIRLIKTTYGRESEMGRFSSWVDALTFVRCHHWYGDDD